MLIALIVPRIASAGDCPLFVVHDWGVGKIDNKLMFYLGKDRAVFTPIPAPPEGPRWDIVYGAAPLVFCTAFGGMIILRPNRRSSNQTNSKSSA